MYHTFSKWSGITLNWTNNLECCQVIILLAAITFFSLYFICIFRVSLSTFVKRNSYRSVVQSEEEKYFCFEGKIGKVKNITSNFHSKYYLINKKAFLKLIKNGKFYNRFVLCDFSIIYKVNEKQKKMSLWMRPIGWLKSWERACV